MTKHPSAAVRIQKARTALLLDHPFFGSLLFRLGGRASSSIQTMATDGVSLFYNPAFVETLNAAELAGVLAHEVMHPALQHHTRRGGRDRKRWNMACDYAINPLLLDAGLTLPKELLIDHRFHGMSAERIYKLIEEQQNLDGSNGEQENRDGADPGGEGGTQTNSPSADGEPTVPVTPSGFGQVLDAPEPEGDDGQTVAEQAREWKIASSRQRTSQNLRASCRPVSLAASNKPKLHAWTGASCCAAHGQKQFRLTTSGCRPIGGTSGLGSICRVSGLKAPGKSPSPSIVLDLSTRVSWVCSRRRFAPFLKDNDQAGCMCFTSILRSIKPRSIKQGSRSRLAQQVEEE
jgi:hypothetical protein